MKRHLVTFALVILLAACVPGTSTEPPATEPATEEPAPTEASAPTTAASTDAPTATAELVEPTDAPNATDAETGYPPLEHRDAPAPPEVFIRDTPEFVGETGRPQLLEFFTEW